MTISSEEVQHEYFILDVLQLTSTMFKLRGNHTVADPQSFHFLL